MIFFVGKTLFYHLIKGCAVCTIQMPCGCDKYFSIYKITSFEVVVVKGKNKKLLSVYNYSYNIINHTVITTVY